MNKTGVVIIEKSTSLLAAPIGSLGEFEAAERTDGHILLFANILLLHYKVTDFLVCICVCKL